MSQEFPTASPNITLKRPQTLNSNVCASNRLLKGPPPTGVEADDSSVQTAVPHSEHLPPNSARFSYVTEWGTLYLRAAVHRRGQRPTKGLGTNNYDCRSNLAPKHARKHEAHPPQVKKKKKKRVPSRCKQFRFYWSWRKQHGQLLNKRLI